MALSVAAFSLLLLPAGAAAAAAPAPVDASPLAANGFASPACLATALSSQLSVAQRTNCAVSGVDVAPVPLSNYAVDINIPSGLDASVTDDLYTVVQDLVITPVWTAVVWLVHVVLIALEWCYAIDLLAPATFAHLTPSLAGARRVFTDPWLGLVLAVAAVAFSWQGLVRRRVLDTLGKAGLLVVMVCAGLWIVADPVGTVGAVGSLADRAALATVAASSTGNPAAPVSTVDGAFAQVFDTAISGPWCYLEFGDVNWCREPSALDPRLHATANSLEAQLRAEATCRGPSPGLVQCAPAGSALQNQLAGAATALGEARNNGELFLAVPPYALARTALPAQTPTPTLYGTLCGSNDPTACTAATAPQAEFRTASGTWPRVGGLLLIVAGTVGMLLLLGFLALRLLGAALATLVYLMLGPLAVLAPALGDPGRDAFRLWLTRLVGAALAKLVYSVALGVVLLIATMLDSLDGLGWWTQWLLISVFWWMAFDQRHRLLSLVIHERGEPLRKAPLATRLWLAGRNARASAGVARASGRFATGATGRAVETFKHAREARQDGGNGGDVPAVRFDGLRPGSPRIGAGAQRLAALRQRRGEARGELRAQVSRLRDASAEAPTTARDAVDGGPPLARAQLAALEARGSRIAAGRREAESRGDHRRAASLALRAQRVDAERAAVRRTADAASRNPAAWGLPGGLVPLIPARLQQERERRAIARSLDRAALAEPSELLRSPALASRLAGLAGISPSEYLRRSPAQQRVARLEIERELARRWELLRSAGIMPGVRLRSAAGRAAAASAESARLAAPTGRRARQFGSRLR